MRRSFLLLTLALCALFISCGGDEPPAATSHAGHGSATPATPAAAATPAPQGAAPTGTAAPRSLTKVTFQAGFQPQANLPFVAAYVAKERGLFAEEGLDVEIQHSSGQDAHLALLAAGRIQFSTTPASTILKQQATSNVPIEAIALFGQRGDTVLAVRADSGITSPKGFEGKTVGYKSFPAPEYLGVLRSAGVDRSKINEVAVGFDPRVLAEKKVDVLPVFRSNEPDVLRGIGVEVTTFDPADFGVPTLGVTYVVNRDWADKNQDTVTAFVRATMRATAWLIEHREEAIDITMKYAPREQRAHQRFMLDVEIAAAQSDLTRRNGIGWMDQAQWQALADALTEYKAIEKRVDAGRAFTTAFLERVYKNGKLMTLP